MQFIVDLVKEGRVVQARNELLNYNVVDIAEFFDELEKMDLMLLFRILPKNLAAEVFSYMNIEGQQYIV